MGVSIFIVLNLGIKKVLFLMPTRLDQNKTGPKESAFIINAINKSIGNNKINKIKDDKKSNDLFIIFVEILIKLIYYVNSF